MSELDVTSSKPDSSSSGIDLYAVAKSSNPMALLIKAIDRLEADIRKMADPNDSVVTRLSSLSLMKRSIDLYDQALLLVVKAPHSDEARKQGERILRLRGQWF